MAFPSDILFPRQEDKCLADECMLAGSVVEPDAGPDNAPLPAASKYDAAEIA